jgi:hypothetical protein
MDASTYFPKKVGALFAEDFDAPEAVPEPEVIEPVFSADELATAREAAWREGHEAGLREAAASDEAATRQVTAAIAEQCKTEWEAVAVKVEESVEAIARLLFDGLAATFPSLCARYGDAEVRAIARAVLPTLIQEPAITVRAHPSTVAALGPEMARLDPDITTRMQTVGCDAMPPGDVRIAWRNGVATRDATALWQQVAEILVPAGLMRADATIKEMVDG